MEIKLFDSELKIMGILWKKGDTAAKRIAELLNCKREENPCYLRGL